MTDYPDKKGNVVKAAEAAAMTNATDRFTTIIRAVVGAVPGAGSILAEVVTNAIPNQRLDRVSAFLVQLAEEVERLSAIDKLTHPSNAALIEEGISQAARAFSAERRHFLAKCVAYGVGAEEADKLAELKILRLLNEVGDDDLLLLDAVSDPDETTKLAALQPSKLPANAPYEDRAKGELYKASFRKLLAIGFLSSAPYVDEPRRRRPYFHGALEDGPYISALGRMVLSRVGLRPEGKQVD